jgi:hypothetical protein
VNRKFVCVCVVLLSMFCLQNVTARKQDNSWRYLEKDPAKKICFALYTVQNNVLKMMVQLYPLAHGESRDVRLEINRGDKWETVQGAGEFLCDEE